MMICLLPGLSAYFFQNRSVEKPYWCQIYRWVRKFAKLWNSGRIWTVSSSNCRLAMMESKAKALAISPGRYQMPSRTKEVSSSRHTEQRVYCNYQLERELGKTGGSGPICRLPLWIKAGQNWDHLNSPGKQISWRGGLSCVELAATFIAKGFRNAAS